MNQHTRGPWKFRNVENAWNTVSNISGSQAIAKVFGAGSAQGESNARLIAEAPAMYETLKHISSCNYDYTECETCQEVDAILARIEGTHRPPRKEMP